MLKCLLNEGVDAVIVKEKVLHNRVQFLTSYFKLLQVAIVLGAVEEKSSLTFRTLDEAVGSEELFYHTSLSDARR